MYSCTKACMKKLVYVILEIPNRLFKLKVCKYVNKKQS